METSKELAIRALENMRGDDLYRAKLEFRGLTPEQMDEPYDYDKTRAEILAEYQEFEDRVNAAIAWVRSIQY